MHIPGTLNLRRADPDQLDHTLRIVSPISVVTLAMLAIIVAGGLIWAAVATVPVKVMANGLLMPARGIVEIPAPSSGPLAEMPVRVGDLVAPGDAIGRVDHPALTARVTGLNRRLDGLRADHQRLALLVEEQRATRERTATSRATALSRQLADIDRRKIALNALLNSQTASMPGTDTEADARARSQWLDLEGQLALLRHERTEVEDTISRLTMERQEQLVADAREIARSDQEVAALERDLAAAQSELDGQSLIRASVAGRVVELSASVGDIVGVGTPLLRLLPVSAGAVGTPGFLDDELIVLLYASPAEGKRIRPGMMAQIVPSTARIEREGFIHGEVIAVSAIPASREGMQRQLKNAALVDQLMAEGPPFELRVRLLPDDQSPSGYHWSTGTGPVRAVESGTSASGQIVVDRIRMIALLLPRFGGTGTLASAEIDAEATVHRAPGR